MSKTTLLLMVACFFPLGLMDAAGGSNASLYQLAPETWRAEVIPFPLPFAPAIDLEGVEELRFAPGMYNPESETYFTYTFIWWLEGRPRIASDGLERYLLLYFSGLYEAVSKRNEKDVSQFRVTLESSDTPADDDRGKTRYSGTAAWRDPFVTEEELILNLQVTRWYCRDEDRSALFFAASPRPFEHSNWRIMAEQEAGRCRQPEGE